MTDFLFDTNKRDLVIKNGNLVLTDNPSVQNGLIIRDARCVNVYSPVTGIGFNPINSQSSQIVFDLNRWKKQVKQDGAIIADYTIEQKGFPNAEVNINMNIAYQ